MTEAILIDSDILIDHLRKEQSALSIGDAVIAATAKEMGMKLVTRNIKHYPMKDIDIVKPY